MTIEIYLAVGNWENGSRCRNRSKRLTIGLVGPHWWVNGNRAPAELWGVVLSTSVEHVACRVWGKCLCAGPSHPAPTMLERVPRCFPAR